MRNKETIISLQDRESSNSSLSLKKRRNRDECKFWKPIGKKTSYCTIDCNDTLNQCYGVCPKFQALEAIN
jgi:hypothetical protein